jgi:hypothetical protein
MTEAEIRAAHPDWDDAQVAAEVARLAAMPPTPPEPPKPDPPKPDDGQNRAMAELRRRAEAAEKRAAEAEAAEAERVRKQAEEEGRWKDIADQERARADAATAERDRIRADAEAEKARTNAQRAAMDRKFKDTGYALYLLEQQAVDFTDAAAVGNALDELVKSRADLLNAAPPAPPSGGPPAPGPQGGGPALTAEQIAAMSPDKVRQLDPAVVNAALAAQAAG